MELPKNLGILTLFTEYETIPYGNNWYQSIQGCYAFDKDRFPDLSESKIEEDVDEFKEYYQKEFMSWLKTNHPDKRRSDPALFFEFTSWFNDNRFPRKPVEFIEHKYDLIEIKSHIHGHIKTK